MYTDLATGSVFLGRTRARVFCMPADEVGGDFFDVFRTNAGETVLVLADISGKGLPAAIRMGVGPRSDPRSLVGEGRLRHRLHGRASE